LNVGGEVGVEVGGIRAFSGFSGVISGDEVGAVGFLV